MAGYQYRGIAISVIATLSVLGLTGCAASPSSSSGNTSNSSTTNKNLVTNTGTSNSSTKAQTIPTNTSNASNDTTQNSAAPNTPSTTTPTTTFNTTVAQAMTYVQHQGVHMPPMAPTEPIFVPTVPYLSAQAGVAAYGTYYVVDLYSTDKQVALNSPSLSSLPAMNIIGSFGASMFANQDGAKSQLYQPNPSNSIAPAYQTPPNLPSTTVDLGHGITGTAYKNPSSTMVVGSPMVMWHEGEWTFQVWDAPLSQDIQQAKKIVAYLNTHLLPETYGVFGENIAGDGNHTSAEWVYGSTEYSVFSYHSGLQAAEMAVSMRVYPSGKVRP